VRRSITKMIWKVRSLLFAIPTLQLPVVVDRRSLYDFSAENCHIFKRVDSKA
jgi:hypothetical protein